MLSFPGHVLVIALRKVFLHQIRFRELVFYITLPVYQLLLLFLYLASYPEVEVATVYVGTWMQILSLFVSFLFVFSVDTLIWISCEPRYLRIVMWMIVTVSGCIRSL